MAIMGGSVHLPGRKEKGKGNTPLARPTERKIVHWNGSSGGEGCALC